MKIIENPQRLVGTAGLRQVIIDLGLERLAAIELAELLVHIRRVDRRQVTKVPDLARNLDAGDVIVGPDQLVIEKTALENLEQVVTEFTIRAEVRLKLPEPNVEGIAHGHPRP